MQTDEVSTKARKLTDAQKRTQARIEALEEAAGHLELEWTDDAVERAAGAELAAALRRLTERPSRIVRFFRWGN